MPETAPLSRLMLLAVLAVFTSPLFFDEAVHTTSQDTSYRQRNTRHEGVRPGLASGYDLELLSAVVNYREPQRGLAGRVQVQFYLPPDRAVGALVVRELSVQHHYWLDRVTIPQGWRGGASNLFAWPTAEVLGRLVGFQDIYRLGVVVRLGDSDPLPVEHVAPAALFSEVGPAQVSGYAFAFRTNGAAFLRVTTGEGSGSRLLSEFPRVPAVEPIWVTWTRPAAAKPAWHSIGLAGYFLDTNEKIHKSIRFCDCS